MVRRFRACRRSGAGSGAWSSRHVCIALLLSLAGSATPVHAQIAVRNQGYIPYSDAPINYRSENLSDPVSLLEHRLEQGQVSLDYQPQHGYLQSVLSLLNVPIDSQTLVFSKTSFQYPKISPQYPRALYFNDDVYVGSIHTGKAIELVSFDPMQGAIFYLLDERKVDKPVFQRAELDCTQCHIAAGTRGIPGVLLRSVYPTATGTLAPEAPSYITDQESPLSTRWGGWFVSGQQAQGSLANSAVPASAGAAVAAPGTAPSLSSLGTPYDASSYLGAGSDEVALLVLAHQTQMHNLITLTNYRTRLALYALSQAPATGSTVPPKEGASAPAAGVSLDSLPDATRAQIVRPAEQLLRYLLFINEAPLPGAQAQPALAASPYAREFAARGPRDAQGRSLRDFDLRTRIFRYPCSYLIYSSAFDAIPEPAKGYIYHRLLQVLSGADRSADFSSLLPQDRQAILEILLATKHGLPAEWQAYAGTHQLATRAVAQAQSASQSRIGSR